MINDPNVILEEETLTETSSVMEEKKSGLVIGETASAFASGIMDRISTISSFWKRSSPPKGEGSSTKEACEAPQKSETSAGPV